MESKKRRIKKENKALPRKMKEGTETEKSAQGADRKRLITRGKAGHGASTPPGDERPRPAGLRFQ